MNQKEITNTEIYDDGGNAGNYTWQVKANDRNFNRSISKKRKYADNSIKTSKYNVLTFIPLNLFEQFHRVANIYFLFIIILQMVPAISTVPWFAIMLPLLFLLIIRGIKDLIDDISRSKSDKAINNRPCDILKGQSFCAEKWKDIQVGDIVRLQKDDFVPADLLLLYSLEPNSLCYVETADIDGETNLKFKQALMITHKLLSTTESMAAFNGKVTCEEANSNLHIFTGTLEWNAEKYSLDNEHILLRGCRIRNTETCYGLVIYAGIDSKIMRNCGKVPVKKTNLDMMMNKLVIIVFVILIFCCLSLAITSGFWAKWFMEHHSYIPPLSNNASPAYSAFLTFWGYVILMSTIVPMSMYITLEFIHLVHSMFIDWDLEMYFPENNTPAKARSTSLSDLLGQVEYVFSDKTGTLTRNVMAFKKCCIKTQIYGTNVENEKNNQVVDFKWNKYADNKFCFYDESLIETVRQNEDEILREFFRLLAICHTVMVDRNKDELVYQAASPDEEALVTAARNFGYVFLSRTQDSITTNELGVERTYEVLALMDFNSVRKRMSILVKDPEGRIKLYTKGADDVILARIHSDCTDGEITEKALEMFGRETLRTLCIAYKEVDVSFYTKWIQRYHEASVSLQNRAEFLGMVYEEIETDLQLLGATAIEDKLQDHVPETIQLLKDGNIKVWVLTGDKQETAINIGFSCKLLSDDMEILDEKQIWDILDTYWEENNNLSNSGQDLLSINLFRKHGDSLKGKKIGLVVNGDLLGRILGTCKKKQDKISLFNRLADKYFKREQTQYQSEENLKEWAFVDLASQCQAVICCRVTPKQKSMVVQLVKRYKQVTTLAIGDGANDVNMIKTADIGVGISGLEGTQAVQSSDYALAQFCYLQRLLFVHGRWSYLRIAKFLRYFFYKTFASVLNNVWFAFFNGFTALMVYDSWFIAFYSVNFTAYPVLSLGLFEQDVSAKVSLKLPELYKVGQIGSLFTYKLFCWSLLKGIMTSLATFFITYGAFVDAAGPDGICDYQSFAVTLATSVLLAVTLEIAFEISYWTILSGLAVLISPVSYFLLSLLMQTNPLFKALPTVFPYVGVSRTVLKYGYIWLIILLAGVTSVVPSLIASFVTKHICPNQVNHRDFYKARQKSEVNTVAMTTPFNRGSLRRRSSYAFSHKEGYADLITTGTSLRRTKARESVASALSTTKTELPNSLDYN
ncbi:phospholipid-transporting ATPase IK [Pelobates cultripes]|uniref:Phospholipid-transporting ATPase n=2 Tax=Pelobates cultripes TaxID=61616 RepID=A0AAD1S6B0_PELCU|nr:phospholipid-transporting ATPase IK [Pelobates cultripes]